ncbi:MAG: autotransporter-associated beta strand repeat-containing protein, partial [Verrucomicrobiae bacterium]|nr:autotransporter-associated beta strand repeat-containing protein [Verrucomicrobiae bacterium]
IVKNGAGLLIMSGKNVNSGDVTVNAGTLRLSNNNWQDANFGGRLIVNSGALAEVDTQTFGYFGRPVDISGGTVTAIGGGLYVGTGGGTCNWNGATFNDTGGSNIRARGTFAIGGSAPTTVDVDTWQVFANITFDVADATSDDAADLVFSSASVTDNGNVTIDKDGVGTLTLNAPLTLDGASSAFHVNAGTVILNSTSGGSDAAPWTVADGATLGGEGSIGGSLILGSSTGAGLAIDLSTAETFGVGGDLTLNGTSTVSLSGTPNNSSAIAVMTFGGTLTGTPATALAVEPADAAHYRSTAFSTVGNTIILDLGSTSLTWNTGTWDVGNDSNWNSGTDQFFWGDTVTFDDTASSGSVTIDAGSGEIAPSSVVVDNSSVAYTFTGDIIAGGASLTKNGSGTLTLSNGSNSYSNGTVI